MTPGAPPLAGLRVVDLTTELGTLAGRLLSGLGTRVTRVVPPGGDRLELREPLTARANGEPVSLYWLHMMRGRALLTADLATPAGRATVETLIANADIVVESQGVGRLKELGVDEAVLRTRHPRLIWTSITPFGLTGPRAGWAGTDLIGMAAGGLMSLCGDPDRAPLRISTEQGYAQAGVQAVVGTLAALHARNFTGGGQLVDVSMQEAIANCLGNARLVYEIEGVVSRRAGGARAYGDHGSRLVFPCADGYVAFSRIPDSMQPLYDWITANGGTCDFDPIEWAGLPQAGPKMPGPEKARELEGTLERFFATRTKDWLYEEGQRHDQLICPVSTPADLFASPQFQARGFFREEHVPELGRAIRLPGPPVRMAATPWSDDPVETEAPTSVPPSDAAASDARAILAGLKVADFSWVGVGPLATQQLAWMGADVIRVESTARLDIFRSSAPNRGQWPDSSAYFANCNRDKRGMTLNLRRPEAREAALRLARWSDVLIESFAPGFMASAGLSYEDIRTVNPGIIMMSASMEGANGPHAGFRGFGLTLQSTAGFTYYTGWPGRPPTGTGVAYTDWFATGIAASTLLAAIEHRRRTGEGQFIDLSQLEACMWALDAELLRYAADGTIRPPQGNRHEMMAPHGVFPSTGKDEWLALAVRDDGDWVRLVAIAAEDGIVLSDGLDFAGRKANEAAIEAAIAAWTSGHNRHALAARLQSAGIPAYPVNSVADVQDDAQLRARGHFWRVAHPQIGTVDWDGPAYRLSDTPMSPGNPAPMLGQHNDEVYRDVLGYTDAEIANLAVTGVIE